MQQDPKDVHKKENIKQKPTTIARNIDAFDVRKHCRDALGQLTFLEERWLHRLANVPKPSLTVFGLSRNRYVDGEWISFEMSGNSYKISDASIQLALDTNRSYWNSWSSGARFGIGLKSSPISEQPISRMLVMDQEQTYGKPTEGIQSSTGLSGIFSEENPSADDFIPRRTETYGSYGHLENYIRSEGEMEERRKLDNPEEKKTRREQLAQYFLSKYKRYTQEEMDVYSPFAQRMRDNTLAFENFCSTVSMSN